MDKSYLRSDPLISEDLLRPLPLVPPKPSKKSSKISDTDKKAIETGISDLRNALKGTDTEEVKKKTQTLIQSSMKLGEAVYKSQQKDNTKKDTKPNQDSKNKDQNKEDVVDSDFEEVKEDKNDKDKEKRA